jgi:nitrate/nitrite-specific signal transduction histidine kinase
MRERAELTGARLEVGPQADGGWLVSLALPTLEQADGADGSQDREESR